MELTYYRCQTQDIPTLRKVAYAAFRTTFSAILNPEQMDYMLEKMYGEKVLIQDISNEDQLFYMAYHKKQVIGYISITTPEHFIKERTDHGQARNGSPANLKVIKEYPHPVYILHKIYLSPEMKGRGLGRLLWQKAFDLITAWSDKKPALMILQVNRKNPAVNFYKHLGMKCMAKQDFVLEHGFEMNDYVMGIDINTKA